MRIADISSRYQPLPDMCFQTAVKIAYDELCKAFGETPNMSIHQISKLSKYERGVWEIDYAVQHLNAYLNRKGYIFREKPGGENDMKAIERILNDGNMSAPIVTVGSSWLNEMDKLFDIDEVPKDDEHELVVLDVSPIKVIVYDTYAPFYKASASGLIAPRTEKETARFQYHWRNASNELMWIERIQKDVGRVKPQKKLIANER